MLGHKGRGVAWRWVHCGRIYPDTALGWDWEYMRKFPACFCGLTTGADAEQVPGYNTSAAVEHGVWGSKVSWRKRP